MLHLGGCPILTKITDFDVMEGIKMTRREINTNSKTTGNYLRKKIIIREKLSQITWIVILT